MPGASLYRMIGTAHLECSPRSFAFIRHTTPAVVRRIDCEFDRKYGAAPSCVAGFALWGIQQPDTIRVAHCAEAMLAQWFPMNIGASLPCQS
jgi:hypothetical protein